MSINEECDYDKLFEEMVPRIEKLKVDYAGRLSLEDIENRPHEDRLICAMIKAYEIIGKRSFYGNIKAYDDNINLFSQYDAYRLLTDDDLLYFLRCGAIEIEDDEDCGLSLHIIIGF